ncbi:WAT1-related protein At4g08300 [Glycine max]|uniref:WAT1-related protein At4g08300 n=1 Tax=Glycine max TaxID=3847 RepID=UPI001B355EB4|nr:WAT1-related protein At4g08300-like [Glycine max]
MATSLWIMDRAFELMQRSGIIIQGLTILAPVDSPNTDGIDPVAVQFGSAGMFIFGMDSIKKGMSHYVFIVYRNAIASVSLAPFAFVLERKVRPKMTFWVFSEIMALAFFEIMLDQCFALLGMKFTSASFLSAVMNSAHSVTFVMAVILRI